MGLGRGIGFRCRGDRSNYGKARCAKRNSRETKCRHAHDPVAGHAWCRRSVNRGWATQTRAAFDTCEWRNSDRGAGTRRERGASFRLFLLGFLDSRGALRDGCATGLLAIVDALRQSRNGIDHALGRLSATLRSAANIYLKEINGLLESSDIYVMKMDGETIAASNYDGPTSFVGQNFSYRPYFQDAARGEQSRFYALGTTSLKRGYYFASPIRVGDAIRGVIVFKVDIDSIETSWQGGEYKIFVTDPEGIIFMTGSPHWLYHSILPLTQERIDRTSASRRYSDAVLKPLPFTERVEDGHRIMSVAEAGGTRDYLVLSQSMPDADWTVNVLTDTASARAQAQTVVIAVLLVLCLVGLGVAILMQRRARLDERLHLQEAAQVELERRVEERTADLARVNTRIEAAVPFVIRSCWVRPGPSAAKRSRSPNARLAKRVSPDVPRTRSATLTVPAAVPSVRQSSRPRLPKGATK